jgi:selenocysteine lyase/cysteine desulfurase
MWTGLSSLPGVRVFGPPPKAARTPTIAFAVQGKTSDVVARQLADRAIFVSHGDFYATTVIERLGYARDGFVRAGCACYTTENEVDRLVEGVRAITSAR